MSEKANKLRALGWIVGERDARINTDYPGKFMVAEPYEEKDLPTKDASNGPFAIVGDDLEALMNELIAFWPIRFEEAAQ